MTPLTPLTPRASLPLFSLLILLLAACSSSLEPQDSFVTLSLSTPAEVSRLSANVLYDKGALEFVGAASQQDRLLVLAEDHAGQVSLGAVATAPVGDEVATVTFRVKQPGAQPWFERVTLYDEDGEHVEGSLSSLQTGPHNPAASYDPAVHADALGLSDAQSEVSGSALGLLPIENNLTPTCGLINCTPVAVDDEVIYAADAEVVGVNAIENDFGSLLDNINDGLTIVAFTQPDGPATVELINAKTPPGFELFNFLVRPNGAAGTTITFEYTLANRRGQSDTATVTLIPE